MIEYLKNQDVVKKLSSGFTYRKKDVTLLRKPSESEIGSSIITYVKSTESVVPRKESETVISKEHIIARNDHMIGHLNGMPVYNEWPIHQDTVIKNYGKEVFDSITFAFLPYKKKSTVQAIELTQDILSLLSLEGSVLEIKVSWSEQPMIAHIGDYLTTGGYSISKADMNAYELIE